MRPARDRHDEAGRAAWADGMACNRVQQSRATAIPTFQDSWCDEDR